MEYQPDEHFDEDEYGVFLNEMYDAHKRELAETIEKFRERYPRVVSDSEHLHDALTLDGLIEHVKAEDDMVMSSYFLSVFSPEGHLDSYLSATMLVSPNRALYEDMYRKYESQKRNDRNTIGDVFDDVFELVDDYRTDDMPNKSDKGY